MNRIRLKVAGSILLILASAAAVWRSAFDAPPAGPGETPRRVGRVLAGEASKLLKPGGKIVLIVRDTAAFPQPAFDAMRVSLEAALREAGTPATITRAIQLDPLRPLQVPPGDFVELLRKAGPADVLVSLLGPPFLSDEQRAGLGVVKPRVVAFWPGTVAEYSNLRPLFEQHLLAAAIVHQPAGLGLPSKLRRSNSDPSAATGGYDEWYQLVTGAGNPPVPIPGLS